MACQSLLGFVAPIVVMRTERLFGLGHEPFGRSLFQRFARVDDADWWFRVKPLVEGRMSRGKLAAAILMLGEVEAS